MNIWFIIAIVASAVAVLMAIAILFGRGDWLGTIAYRLDLESYNIQRLRVVDALSIIVLVAYVWLSHLLHLKSLYVVLGFLVLGIIKSLVERTWARR